VELRHQAEQGAVLKMLPLFNYRALDDGATLSPIMLVPIWKKEHGRYACSYK
jgi:hypothetical protein